MSKRYFAYTDISKANADLESRLITQNSKVAGVVGDSVTPDRTAFNTLVNVTMQPNGGEVDVIGVPRIEANLSIPANVTLNLRNGAYLAPDAGVTVTINGPMVGPTSKRFGGAGSVSLPSPALERIYPQWWGATALGIADDTVPMNAALAAAAGHVLWIDGTFLCNTKTNAGGLSWILASSADNVTIDGPGTIKTTSGTGMLFLVWGAGKPAGMSTWFNSELPTGLTTYTINNAAKGDMSVTCTTAAQAGNFALGDIIYIRTGQTLTIAGSSQPDSELNEVISANAGTGVVQLKYPLAKAYVPQNYPVGHPNAGTPAPFGIAKVTDRILRNFEARNFAIDSTSIDPVFGGGQAIGLRYKNLRVDCPNGTFQSQGNYRFGLATGNKVHAGGDYILTTATGTSDVDWYDNQLSNEKKALCFHIHEGSARVRVHHNLVQVKASAVNETPVSIRAVAHEIEVEQNTIVVQGAISAVIFEDANPSGLYESTGRIGPNTIICPGLLAYALRVSAPSGWVVDVQRGDLGEGAWVEEGSNQNGPLDRIFIAPQQMAGFFGSAPALAVVQNRFPSFTFPDAVTSQVGGTIRIPKYWKSWKMYFLWTNLSAAAGNVFWQMGIAGAAEGVDLSGLASIARVLGGVAAPGQNVLKRTETTALANWLRDTNVDPIGTLVSVWATRIGADAADTLAGSVALLGIELVRIK